LELSSAYRGRRALVTGHTGFKGAWLSIWLHALGAEISGIALAPTGEPNLFDALRLGTRLDSHLTDIREAASLRARIADLAPEIVFHLAAQPLVRRSYADPLETFDTNIMGTANVLEACRATPSVRAVVCITTDKVYDNREWPWPYRERDRLGGLDPYSASKACAELVTQVYQRNLGRAEAPASIATARGGNVVGGGDWAADRIVPDIVRAIVAGAPVRLRNPNAVRPWQHVLELCEGYLELGARLLRQEDGIDEAWNLGPDPSSRIRVEDLVRAVLDQWGCPNHPVEVEPSPLHEAQLLRLDISKALARLSWRPRLGIAETLAWTASWYRAFYDEPSAAWDNTLRQIGQFEALRAGAKA
jgi:CDP-glucose 4,6-dehydratase